MTTKKTAKPKAKKPATKRRKPGPPKGSGGQPTKLKPEIQKAILAALSMGAYRAQACAHANIDPSTFYRWMNWGEENYKPVYRNFYNAIKKAEADGEVKDLAYIEQAAQAGTWQAAAWRLERKYPDRWGRRVAHTGPDGGPVRLQLTAEERDRRLADLLGRVEGNAPTKTNGQHAPVGKDDAAATGRTGRAA